IRADRKEVEQERRDEGRLDLSPQQGQATEPGSSVKFYSPPLDAGIYHFYAVGYARHEEFQSQIAEITLSDSDVTGITLVLAPGAEITGTIAVTDGPVVPSGQKVSILLRSEGPVDRLRRLDAEASPSGGFRISGVFPDRYRLEVAPLLEDAYIRSVELNGSAVHGTLLNFFDGAEGAKLKIVVSGRGAHITGQVRKAKDRAP